VHVRQSVLELFPGARAPAAVVRPHEVGHLLPAVQPLAGAVDGAGRNVLDVAPRFCSADHLPHREAGRKHHRRAVHGLRRLWGDSSTVFFLRVCQSRVVCNMQLYDS
jgi:hypothetical protein